MGRLCGIVRVWNKFNIPNIVLPAGCHVCPSSKQGKDLREWAFFKIKPVQSVNCGLKNTVHLFCECVFSRNCALLIREAGVGTCRLLQATGIAKWISKRYKGSRLRKKTLFTCLSALVYHIWVNRNNCVWEKKCANPKNLVRKV